MATVYRVVVRDKDNNARKIVPVLEIWKIEDGKIEGVGFVRTLEADAFRAGKMSMADAVGWARKRNYEFDHAVTPPTWWQKSPIGIPLAGFGLDGPSGYESAARASNEQMLPAVVPEMRDEIAAVLS